MKRTPWLILLVATVVVTAVGAQPLARRVTLQYEWEPLGEVLADISRRYEVRFSYSSYYIPVERPVTVRVANVTLKSALDTLFAGTDIQYASIGGQIVLKAEPAQLTRLETKPSPMPRPLIDERMAAERERLAVRLPEISGGELRELPGGDRLVELDLEKYRLMLPPVEEIEEVAARVETYHRLAQVSLLPFLGTNAMLGPEMTNNFSLNVFWGANGGVDGVEVGGLVNTITGDVRGIQLAGMGNTVAGTMTGTQLSGLFNVNSGRTSGLQFAGFFNVTRHTDAIQLAGLFNVATQDASGAQVAGLFNAGSGKAGAQVAALFNTSGDSTETQVAGLFNSAGDVKGGQVSVLLNKARRVEGFQIGLINIADTVGGFSAGLLTFVKKGYNRFEIAGNEILYGNLSLKFGTRKLYNILQVGGRWDRINRNDGERTVNGVYMSWGLGYGLGTAFPLGPRSLLNLEGVVMHINELESWTTQLNLLNQLRLTFDKQTGGRVSFFAGPVGNLLVSKLYDADSGAYGSTLPPYALYDETRGETNIKMWVGVHGGVRF